MFITIININVIIYMNIGFNTRHRHYSASVIMVSQGYKEIPKTVRTNFTCGIYFEIANDREVLVIYEENTMGLKKDDWLEMFAHCTKEDYSFLYINSKKPRKLRCMKNFDKVVFFDKERGGEGGESDIESSEDEKPRRKKLKK